MEKKNYFDELVYSVREMAFLLDETIWDFCLEHAHVILEIIILDCKVFKLKRFSSVNQNVSVKHPI